ncbi:MAG: phosphomannomutase/phosphoglucomutase [Deltaproteobacteria bacterium]|nr:phosphomannomutase/phosphoglucomutase [Deltaproteobacteria bacterium]
MAGLSDAIFREYDIRGIFGKDLTPETAALIGRGYALYAKRRGAFKKGRLKITVGRDVRLSGAALRDALINALTTSGVDCVDIGVCPTPLQYFSMRVIDDINGGVMITGSHNPPEYNGFKVSVGCETIHGGEIQELKRIIRAEVVGKPLEAVKHGSVEAVDIVERYVAHAASLFNLPTLNKPIKVVLDSGNGTAGPVAPALLRRLGCEVIELFSEPDGRFPNHHPDPTVEANLKHLMEAVGREKADFGVSYDGDADRIGVVDEKGAVVWGDRLMVIFSKAILAVKPGSTIVGEVKCSQTMYDEIAKAGGVPVMWKTGHSLIKARMKELKAAMAGEMSGHIFFADRYFGFDDAIYASCRLVEIMADMRVKNPAFVFSSLLAGMPETIVTPEIRIDCADDKKFEVIERLDKAIGAGDSGIRVKDVIRIDGLRINFDGGWALVRASNTQPVLVLRFEATDLSLLDGAKAFMKGRLEAVESGLSAGI